MEIKCELDSQGRIVSCNYWGSPEHLAGEIYLSHHDSGWHLLGPPIQVNQGVHASATPVTKRSKLGSSWWRWRIDLEESGKLYVSRRNIVGVHPRLPDPGAVFHTMLCLYRPVTYGGKQNTHLYRKLRLRIAREQRMHH